MFPYAIGLLFIVGLLTYVVMLRSNHQQVLQVLWWIATMFALALLYSAVQQLERQVTIAEQQTGLLQESGAMNRELGELVKVLKEFQAAEATSAPKR